LRTPPPGLLKLDRNVLLADVRRRLAEQVPAYANAEEDPTDPGWLLLEQSAWLVELLSEQLDKYPFSVVQHFVHMMGGHIRPAQPALGVLLCDVYEDGKLVVEPGRESPWRFFSPQDEDTDVIEFVPAESGVSLRKAGWQSLCEVAQDELYLVGPTSIADGLEGQGLWRGARRRSRVFDREEVWFDAVTNNPTGLREALQNALTMLAERRIGWLSLRVEDEEVTGKERVRLVARIHPAGAFARTAPEGIWSGGDLEGDWGTLDGTTWTPMVTIRRHSMLPSHLHDQFPLPGSEEGQILIVDVPENFSVADLLDRRASPIPEVVVEAIWQTLGNLDARVGIIKPAVQIVFQETEEARDLEPSWVAAALGAGAWSIATQDQPKTLAHLALGAPSPRASSVRVGLLMSDAAADRAGPPVAYAIRADGSLDRTRLVDGIGLKEAWRLPVPLRESGREMPLLITYDIEVPGGTHGLLLVSGGAPSAVMVNPLLIINAPFAADSRQVLVETNTPSQVSLFFEDVVDRSVIEQLLEEPIPNSTAKILRRLPLAWFPVSDQEPIVDFQGVTLDPTEGQLTLNAPDASGFNRTFRLGHRLQLNVYRYTNGAHGNRPAGAVRVLEQPSAVVPKIYACANPVPTFFGGDREAAEAAVERMFGPTEGTPVMATDWERQIRMALGNRARGWHLRVWTYAERTFVSTALWPFPLDRLTGDEEARRGSVIDLDDVDPDVAELEGALGTAGPDTLLVVIGPPAGELTQEDFDWARRTIERLVERHARRLPTVRRAVVARFHPLVLEQPSADANLLLPLHDIPQMKGRLMDGQGRSASGRPSATLLLNAAVVAVQETGEADL
jgi:hypothetical protein